MADNDKSLDLYAAKLGRQARAAAAALRGVPGKARDKALKAVAVALRQAEKAILAANAADVADAKAAGLTSAMVDRLTLTPERLRDVAKSVEEIAALPDPLGKPLWEGTRPNGMVLRKESVPLGTILFIFESRPNVTIDGGALCFKSGNAVVLRGGKEAVRSNRALAKVFRETLKAQGLPVDAVQLVEKQERSLVDRLLVDTKNLDLVIPRGGEGLIRAVVEKARIPVIKHYKGVCHVYVDASADPAMAAAIAVNAKAQRPGTCNAAETLLLDKAMKPSAAQGVLEALAAAGVSLVGNAAAAKISPLVRKGKADVYDTEWLDMVMNVALVDGVDGAVAHIAEHGTGHTETVVASKAKAQQAFLAGVESSSVLVNASTRLADGGQFGLGAEVGTSTDKLHARGPMGIESLTTYRWVGIGNGQLRK